MDCKMRDSLISQLLSQWARRRYTLSVSVLPACFRPPCSHVLSPSFVTHFACFLPQPTMEDSSFNLQTPTSPRIRPGGPRNRRQNFKSPTPLTLDGGNTSPSDDAVPAYFGRNSPAMSSSRPHSPAPFLVSMPSISQLSDSNYVHPRPSAPMVERGVQVNPADLQSSVSTPSRATTPAVKLITKPPTLEPPPSLNFESTAIQWKGLTLEAAQWTFSSQELQDIVSRAIRKSAEESFIRLLSVKTLDEELVEESKRLDHVRAFPLFYFPIFPFVLKAEEHST